MTLALLVPCTALLWWLFQQAGPVEYFTFLYSPFENDWPMLARMPVLAATLSLILAFVSRSNSNPLQSMTRPTLAPVFALIAGLVLLASPLFCGSALLFQILHAATGVFILLAACALGLRVLSLPILRLKIETAALELLVLATTLGLGILALLVFVLGTLGLLSTWFWWAALILVVLQGLPLLAKLAAGLQAASNGFARNAGRLGIAAVLFVIFYAGIHAVLIWSPPAKYDILEYHLGAVAEYLRDGRISFLHQNIYATFPENGEMLYLLGMVLNGEKFRGLPAAHAIVFAAWTLTICGVYALVRRLTQAADPAVPAAANSAPALAALLYALIPMGSDLAGDFYVEHAQALFHLAAVMAGCAYLNERRAGSGGKQWLILSGLLAGLCCGIKYTALLFTVAPLAVLIPILCLPGGSIFEALRAVFCIGLPALLAVSPWLGRNLIVTGDPIFPLGLVLARRLSISPNNTADRLAHFEVAHRAGEKSLNAFMRALAQLLPRFGSDKGQWFANAAAVEQDSCGPQLAFFALPGFLSAARIDVLLVAGMFVMDLLIWFLFTHRLNRFMFPLLSPLAVISGVGIAGLWRTSRNARGAVVALSIFAVLLFTPLTVLHVWLLSQPDLVTGIASTEDSARQQYHIAGDCSPDTFEAWLAINKLPPDSRVLCIGDQQTFYLDKTPEYAVVFNTPLIEEILNHSRNADDAMLQLGLHGVTHFYINYPEWVRLDASYSITRSSLQEPWRYARAEDKSREPLRLLLQRGEFTAYGKAWPPNVHPAFLKLTPEGYAVLDDLMHRLTVVEKFWEDHGWRTCEIRRLQK